MKFRAARHTNDMQVMIDFYTTVMGLEVTDGFEDHNGGYSGVILGHPGSEWELEFTTSADEASHTFDQDDNIVFYAANEEEYNEFLGRISENNVVTIQAANPYWNDFGVTVQDPDGYNVIVSNRLFKTEEYS